MQLTNHVCQVPCTYTSCICIHIDTKYKYNEYIFYFTVTVNFITQCNKIITIIITLLTLNRAKQCVLKSQTTYNNSLYIIS